MRENTKHMPLDIAEIILSKLPIKSILRFRAMSKSWNAIIMNPGFARIHLNNYTYYNSDDIDDNRLFMSPSDHHTELYVLGMFDGIGMVFRIISYLQSPLENKLNPSPLCSCDGFFLIYDTTISTTATTCVLWNPISKSRMSFACPEIMDSPVQTTHGICYDPLEDDYKVVFINRVMMLYTVFSCRSNSWTETKQFPYYDIKRDPGVSVRGVPYWVVIVKRNELEEDPHVKRTRYSSCYYRRRCIDDEIVYFDARDYGFKKFHKPDEVRETDDLIYLTSLNGRLCLYQQPPYMTDPDIWVLMQDNAWTKLTAWPPPPYAREIMKKTLLSTESGSIYLLFIAGHRPVIVLFDENKVRGRAWRVTYLDMEDSEIVAVQGTLAILPPQENDTNAV